MRLRNEGGNWSDSEPYSDNKSWALSCCTGSPATVRVQTEKGSTIPENLDDICVEKCRESWNAADCQAWIEFSDYGGSGSATVTVYLRSTPTDP